MMPATNKHGAGSPTPNVVIENPKTRKIIRRIVDGIGAAIFVAVAVDVSTTVFDISEITYPFTAGWVALRVVFGFSVDDTNTPKA